MDLRCLRLSLAVFGVATLLPLRLAAQASTTERSSILFFPKVVADGTWDTTIQITNQTRNQREAHCFYVNATLAHPDAPPGPDNLPVWQSIDFDIFLTAMQPTHWVVSRGRMDDPTDPSCDAAHLDCNGAGYDPGRVPAPLPGFRGEAVCIEEDASGFPVPGNALVGKATLTNLASGDIATYNAIGLRGLDSNDESGTLCLGGGVTADCPQGAEYTSCPLTWILDHPTEGAADPVAGDGSIVSTTLTVAPCRLNLRTQVPEPVTVQFRITNAFEQIFSASTTITCWADVALSEINSVFQSGALGTDYAQTRILTATLSDVPPPGIAVVAQTFRTAGGLTTSAATNLHSEGARSDTDLIVIPVQ